MRFARFTVADQIAYGVVEGEADDPESLRVTALNGHPFAPFEMSSAVFALADVRLLPPVLPNKVIGIGKNYAEHAKEMGSEAPATPVMFLKPPTSVVGTNESIMLPPQSRQVEYEGELAIVIGRLAREVPRERVDDVILGVTCANDVTARDLQKLDGQWTRAKGFDSFCPIGPWIATGVDVSSVDVTTTVNGEVRQHGNSADLVHSVADLIVFVSSVMTLLPGDVILTGTPAGVGLLADGDQVAVSITGVGTLVNQVVAA